MSVTKRNSPPWRKMAGERDTFHLGMNRRSNAAVSATVGVGSDRCASTTLQEARDQADGRRQSADEHCAAVAFIAASAMAMPLTKGSTPISPTRGALVPVPIIDSPRRKPISS